MTFSMYVPAATFTVPLGFTPLIPPWIVANESQPIAIRGPAPSGSTPFNRPAQLSSTYTVFCGAGHGPWNALAGAAAAIANALRISALRRERQAMETNEE